MLRLRLLLVAGPFFFAATAWGAPKFEMYEISPPLSIEGIQIDTFTIKHIPSFGVWDSNSVEFHLGKYAPGLAGVRHYPLELLGAVGGRWAKTGIEGQDFALGHGRKKSEFVFREVKVEVAFESQTLVVFNGAQIVSEHSLRAYEPLIPAAGAPPSQCSWLMSAGGKPIPASFGAWLASALEQGSVSAADLAARTTVPADTITGIQTGTLTNPDMDTMIKIAHGMGTDLGTVFSRLGM